MKGGAKVIVEKHRHEGIFIARGKEDALLTKNMVPGESVYGEKRISVDVGTPVIIFIYFYFIYIFSNLFYLWGNNFYEKIID